MSVAQRDAGIDRAKGLLILLVVLGHMAGSVRFTLGESGFAILDQAYIGINLFHMAAFFFLAGFWRTRNEHGRTFGAFVAGKARRLLVPYVFWGVASAVVFVALGSALGLVTGGVGYYEARGSEAVSGWQPFVSLLHAGGWPRGEGFRCNSVLWFLPAMFVTSIFHEALTRVRGWGNGILPCAAALGCFALAGVLRLANVDGLPWGLAVVPWYLGFMVLGGLAGRRVDGAGRGVVAFGAAALLGICCWWPDLGLGWRSIAWYAAHLGVAALGSWVCVVGVRGWRCGWLEWLGAESLGIMVLHKFFVLACQVGCRQVRGQVPDAVMVVAAVVLAVGVAGACGALSRGVRRILPGVV